MSVNYIDKSTGDLIRVAGGGNDILYADSPIGSIIPFGGTTAPTGFLLCQGQAVSRTTYAELFAVIGTSFGSGDGSTTFNVPDLRESVPVGAGTSTRSAIATHDSYTIGEFKDDQMQSHKHRMDITTADTMTVYGLSYAANTGSTNATETREVSNARNGATTHGKQLGVNYIIKATQVDAPADFAPVDVVENGNMKAVTSNAVYNTLMNTTIIQSNVKRSVTQDPTISTWYSAELQKPTIPAGKRLVRWLGFTDAEKMAVSVGNTHGGVDNCILVNGDTGDSTPITFNVWWGAEIADY